MPTVNVNIQPAIISWALSQTSEEKLGNVPRGVFCEQSSQKTRELRREIMLCMISVHREARYCERSEQ